jgi:hypothetical protein
MKNRNAGQGFPKRNGIRLPCGIAWSDIESAYVRSTSGNDFIYLELKNAEEYAQKLSKVKRAMAAANRNLGFTDFNLNLSGVNARTDEVFELVMKYCQVAAESQPDNGMHQSPPKRASHGR